MAFFIPSAVPALDSNGNPISGAKWEFYHEGTLAPASVYSDNDLGTSLGSSDTANGAGRFANIYLDDAVSYRAILKDAGGATIKDIPVVNPGQKAQASTRSALAGLITGSNRGVLLTEAGREGLFVWQGADLSPEVASDPRQGIYVPPAADRTGAAGAWVRHPGVDTWIKASWFGAAGTYSADDTAALQAAINLCPTGGTVELGTGWLDGRGGDYKITDTLRITRHVNLFGHKSRIVGVMADNNTDLIQVEPAAEVRGWTCRGLFLQFNSGGRDALRIGNDGVGFLHAIIENNAIIGGAGGWAVNFQGVGTHFNTVRNNYIAGAAFSEDAVTKKPLTGGVRIAGADCTKIYDNLIGGIGCGLLVDVIPGAYRTGIHHNGIVSRDIGVAVFAGQKVDILSNQFEQGIGNAGGDVNQAFYAGHIILYGSSFAGGGEEVRDIRIKGGNNFGSAGNQVASIILVAYTLDVQIDEADFNNVGTSGADIQIIDPSCKWTRIGANCNVYGGRSVGARGAPNTVDPKMLLNVSDNGTGTYGFVARKVPALAANYTGSVNFAVWKDDWDQARLEGSIVIGAGAATSGGTTIFTLPEGMRPPEVTLIGVRNSVNATPSYLTLNVDGQVTVESNVNVSSTLFISSAPPITARGRTSYLSGPN